MVTIIILAVFAFIVVGVVLYFVAVYNGLIFVSRNIDKSWANIDVLLKQRHDEIPKLIKVCEGYAQYERSTLEKITLARTNCIQARTVADASKAEGELTQALGSLFAVAENYPDLKANQNFIQMQQRISYLESQIADRRELFNDTVNSYNIRIATIPDLFVANMMGMKPKDMFKVSDEDKTDVGINFELPK
ncbi:MAG TPA: LemA family protein [Candidatus Omnitrophota bacterium]|nr:LemA family protein [Candidatus Omnitrophota bacterium]HPS20324.1 LemA family protein [Candidatus Omnitrophota bacterium]